MSDKVVGFATGAITAFIGVWVINFALKKAGLSQFAVGS